MVIDLLRVLSVLIAAMLLGNWFQKELKNARIRGLPWYRPYLSPPGLLIILAVLLLPILVSLLGRLGD